MSYTFFMQQIFYPPLVVFTVIRFSPPGPCHLLALDNKFRPRSNVEYKEHLYNLRQLWQYSPQGAENYTWVRTDQLL